MKEKRPRIPIYTRGDRLKELRRLLKANPRDIPARHELADAYQEMGRRRQAEAQRRKASQAARFDPDFDYHMDGGSRITRLLGPSCILTPVMWGEVVRVDDLALRLGGVEHYPAELMQRAILATHVDAEASANVLFEDDSCYPLLPQETLKQLFEMGTPGERPGVALVGEEGYTVAHDAEHDMYALHWPKTLDALPQLKALRDNTFRK